MTSGTDDDAVDGDSANTNHYAFLGFRVILCHTSGTNPCYAHLSSGKLGVFNLCVNNFQ